MIEEAQVRDIARSTTQSAVRGVASEVARELAEQRAEFEAHVALLGARIASAEARIAGLERLFGALIAPATTSPADDALARH